MKDTGFSVPAGEARPAGDLLPANRRDRRARRSTTTPRTASWAEPPAFPSGGGGLVSTVDDYLAFGQMLLDKGRHGSERILSRPSVELMTTDQLTPEQKAASPFFPASGTAAAGASACRWSPRRDDLGGRPAASAGTAASAPPGRSDPHEDLVAILLIQRLMTGPGFYDINLELPEPRPTRRSTM